MNARSTPVALAIALVGVAAGCAKEPAPTDERPAREPVPSAAPVVSGIASSAPATAKVPSDFAGQRPGIELGPDERADRAAREQEVLDLMTGSGRASELPVVATEPGVVLDPGLRYQLAPYKKPPRIRNSKVVANGSIPKQVIQRIVRHRFSQLRRCYTAGIEKKPSLAGDVAISFVIDAEGRTKIVTTTGSTLAEQSVVQCMSKVVERFRFPKPKDGAEKVSLTFTLTPE